MIDFNEMEMADKIELKDALVGWLLDQRLQNYGYDWRDFKALSSKASRLRSKVRKRGINLNINFGILNRLEYDAKHGFNYCVGQSFNEEYITLLECFTNFKTGGN